MSRRGACPVVSALSLGVMPVRLLVLASVATFACSDAGSLAPTQVAVAPAEQYLHGDRAGDAHALNPSDDNGYIAGWFDGEEVQLHYTKSFFCAEPPLSGASSNCEIGAPAEVAPRNGPIPTIYAIAAVGFTPAASTVACAVGSPCLNHPAMIDASRIGGPPSARALSHSHVLERRAAGWFHTVNIRVSSESAWYEIAAAKTLDKVRELQGGNPAVGTAGVISADTPTNIYFFIAGWR
jgi:hypothetical protein